MKIYTYKCDICGRQKGEGNGWFTTWVQEGDHFGIGKWEHHVPDDLGHLCGIECAHKALDRWFQGREEAGRREA